MKKHFINLTPHKISEVKTGRTFDPSGKIARLNEVSFNVDTIDGIDIYKTKLGDIIDLPEPKKDTIYIVSSLVLGEAKNRRDVVAPGKLQRNKEGQPTGCLGFKI